jgi:hypothetical protein
MRTIIITFTHEGMKAAKKAREATDGEVIIYCHQRCADAYKNEVVSFAAVGSVIKSEFAVSDRILFVCAVAIAVRTIAPYLISKVTDPAVLVEDEGGKYLISLLSGHIGGANEWCSKLAVKIGAMPVIICTPLSYSLLLLSVYLICPFQRSSVTFNRFLYLSLPVIPTGSLFNILPDMSFIITGLTILILCSVANISTANIPLASVAVVITGIAPILTASLLHHSLAPPI